VQVTGILYALICAIWGSTWVVIKVGIVGVPPFLAAGLRFLLSTFVVGLILAARRTRITLTPDDKICVLSLGFLVFGINYGAVYWAELYISSGLTAVLFSTIPLMTALLSTFWMRSETLTAPKLAGILVGIAGTALLFSPNERLGTMQVAGMAATLAAALCSAVNLVMMKKHGTHSDAFVLNFLGMAIGAVSLLAISAAFEPWSATTWTLSNVLALLYLSLFGSVVAFWAYYYLIKRLDATVVSLASLVIPVVALALGRALLNETIAPTALLGIAITLAGVAVAVVPWHRLAPRSS
jgi:drug/metabolite transporter (DMT)-like permease